MITHTHTHTHTHTRLRAPSKSFGDPPSMDALGSLFERRPAPRFTGERVKRQLA